MPTQSRDAERIVFLRREAEKIMRELFQPDGLMPPQLAGLIASFGGMIVGSLAVKSFGRQATT